MIRNRSIAFPSRRTARVVWLASARPARPARSGGRRGIGLEQGLELMDSAGAVAGRRRTDPPAARAPAMEEARAKSRVRARAGRPGDAAGRGGRCRGGNGPRSGGIVEGDGAGQSIGRLAGMSRSSAGQTELVEDAGRPVVELRTAAKCSAARSGVAGPARRRRASSSARVAVGSCAEACRRSRRRPASSSPRRKRASPRFRYPSIASGFRPIAVVEVADGAEGVAAGHGQLASRTARRTAAPGGSSCSRRPVETRRRAAGRQACASFPRANAGQHVRTDTPVIRTADPASEPAARTRGTPGTFRHPGSTVKGCQQDRVGGGCKMAEGLSVKPLRAITWTDVDGREAGLIQRCAARDEDACAELVSEHQRMVYQLSLNLLGDHNEALDLSQEVFLRVFRTIHGFRGQSRPPHLDLPHRRQPGAQPAAVVAAAASRPAGVARRAPARPRRLSRAERRRVARPHARAQGARRPDPGARSTAAVRPEDGARAARDRRAELRRDRVFSLGSRSGR